MKFFIIVQSLRFAAPARQIEMNKHQHEKLVDILVEMADRIATHDGSLNALAWHNSIVKKIEALYLTTPEPAKR